MRRFTGEEDFRDLEGAQRSAFSWKGALGF